MGRRGPQGKDNEARIKSFIASLMANRPDEIRNAKGEISSVKIAKLYHDETGEDVTRQTIATYLKDKDLINYTQITIPESNARMRSIDKRIATALSISDNKDAKDGDRCKALNTYKGLMKFKTDYEAGLRADKLRQADVKKPIYLNVICEPPAVAVCPKCKHSFLVDNSKADEKHLNEWLKTHKHNLLDSAKKDWGKIKTTIQLPKKGFKSGNGQSTLDKNKEGVKDGAKTNNER